MNTLTLHMKRPFGISKSIKRYFASRRRRNRFVRPSLDDVENLSRGKPGRGRIGSRNVPHRLVDTERAEFEVSKKKGFVSLRGSGWRRERGASPLLNIYRQRCDAQARSCISLQRGLGSDPSDRVCVDVSTLRCSSLGKDFVGMAFSALNDTDYQSITCLYSNNTNVTSTKHIIVPELDKAFLSSPIHTLPQIGFEVAFWDRGNAKAFCNKISYFLL